MTKPEQFKALSDAIAEIRDLTEKYSASELARHLNPQVFHMQMHDQRNRIQVLCSRLGLFAMQVEDEIAEEQKQAAELAGEIPPDRPAATD